MAAMMRLENSIHARAHALQEMDEGYRQNKAQDLDVLVDGVMKELRG